MKTRHNEFLEFANAPAENVTDDTLNRFIALAGADARVRKIGLKSPGVNLLYVESDELSGSYRMGKIANTLVESKADRSKRVAEDNAPMPDIIHIKEFWDVTRIPESMKKKLRDYAETIPASTRRAQCSTIINYDLENGETIADRFMRDHYALHYALYAATLAVSAGVANHINRTKNSYGTIVFIDGSKLNNFSDYDRA